MRRYAWGAALGVIRLDAPRSMVANQLSRDPLASLAASH